MSRKTRTDAPTDTESDAATDAATDAAVPENTDLHGFWDRTNANDEHDDAFAVVIGADGDADGDAETLAYMGNVTKVDADELAELAEWAESKACRACRRKLRELHDPTLLRHDECRTALRAGRVLRRYA